MKIIIAGTQEQKSELLNESEADQSTVWVSKIEDFFGFKDADVFIDLLFEYRLERIELLRQLLPSLVIVNSVLHTIEELNSSFIRINGWPTFLKVPNIESSTPSLDLKIKTENVFSQLGRNIEWVDDLPGFITPRIVSMIIKEAYYSLEEKVSSKEEFDIAMKLGTNYPYGPFEWSEKIGFKNIEDLLNKLANENSRYSLIVDVSN
jgi:3-hydroxybutyryl-CoA dehydrogenase